MFKYFGYGSNLDITSLRAKGVNPSASCVGLLANWRLRFNVAHFFRHEGGVANIELTGSCDDRVLGVVHDCDDDAMALLDEAEAYPDGYDRLTLTVETATGPVDAIAYIGTPAFIDLHCLPSRRYLNILVRGATAAGLETDYVAEIADHPTHPEVDAPRFEHPDGEWPIVFQDWLATHPSHTGLDGAIFDMSMARPQHERLKASFGGRDMTLFHLKRMDSSTGDETHTTVEQQRYTDEQRRYLDRYLNEYLHEYRYAGRLSYRVT